MPERALPPLREFVGRRFAVPGPPPSWIVFERLGGLLAFLFASLGLTPGAVTLLGGGFGIAGAVALANASEPGGQVLAGSLLLASYALDCADGQLARATGRSSEWGARLDVTVDGIVIVFVTCATAMAFSAHGASQTWGILLAGAYGACRIANLLIATLVRAAGGGMVLTGFRALARTTITSVMDTPVAYVALSVAAATPEWLAVTLLILTAVTAAQVTASASHHYRRDMGARSLVAD